MEALFWSLVALGVTWILADFLNSRFVYVSNIAHWLVYHGFAHDSQRCACHENRVRTSIQNSPVRFWFRIGVFAGCISLVLTLLLLALASVISSLAELIEAIGRLIA